MTSLLCAALALALSVATAQDDEIPGEKASPPPVAITFTPPDLDGDIVLGIFDAGGKLVRTLRFEPGAEDLVVDTNGYIARWDGRDDRGAACPGGRYSARGFLVGDDMAIAGDAYHFNDWMAEDKIPATAVELRAWPDALGVKIATPNEPVFAKIRADGTLETSTAPAVAPIPGGASPRFDPPPLAWTAGRDGTTWMIVDDGGQHVVTQLAKDGTVERTLRVAKEEPQPAQILASPTEDAILLRETGADGAERIRLLRRGKDSTAEADGKVVADWEVVFERTRQPCADFGVRDGRLVASAGAAKPVAKLPVPLVPNALQPHQMTLTLEVVKRTPGSALVAPGGLALLEIAGAGNWTRFVIVPGATAGKATLYQGDGLVVEQFSLEHLDQIAAFDAGSFLLAAPAQ